MEIYRKNPCKRIFVCLQIVQFCVEQFEALWHGQWHFTFRTSPHSLISFSFSNRIVKVSLNKFYTLSQDVPSCQQGVFFQQSAFPRVCCLRLLVKHFGQVLHLSQQIPLQHSAGRKLNNNYSSFHSWSHGILYSVVQKEHMFFK